MRSVWCTHCSSRSSTFSDNSCEKILVLSVSPCKSYPLLLQFSDLSTSTPGGLQLIACGDYFQLAPVDIELLHEMTCVRCGKLDFYCLRTFESNCELNRLCRAGKLSLQDLESSQSIQVPRGSERTRRYRCTEFLDEKRKRKEGCGIVYEIPTFAFETAAWCAFLALPTYRVCMLNGISSRTGKVAASKSSN